MSEKNRVLAANSEFYQAFLNRDFDRMKEIWSKRNDSWKLIHHQAGPAPDLMDETPTGRPH